jgi:hypothetical protein
MDYEIKVSLIKNILCDIVRIANEARNSNDEKLEEFSRGELNGVIKMLKFFHSDKEINLDFYLNQLPK